MSTQNTTEGRFRALRDYLEGIASDQYNVEMTFDEIAILTGESLPHESAEFEWWTIDPSGPKTPQSLAWTRAGFGVCYTTGTTVAFERGIYRYPGIGARSVDLGKMPMADRLGTLATAYLQSAKVLCKEAGKNPNELTWPKAAVIHFCCRHAIELFLKSCILRRDKIAKCNHDLANLRKLYEYTYPEIPARLVTMYDCTSERNEDQVFRYFSNKSGNSPSMTYGFAPGVELSEIEKLEFEMRRVWQAIQDSETT